MAQDTSHPAASRPCSTTGPRASNVIELRQSDPRYLDLSRIPKREFIDLAAYEVLVVLTALEKAMNQPEIRELLEVDRVRRAHHRLSTILEHL